MLQFYQYQPHPALFVGSIRLSAPLKTSVVVMRGIFSGSTFTRATTASVTDHEGLIKTAKIGEMRFQGARRVENLITVSSESVMLSGLGTSPPTVTTTTTYLGKTCSQIDFPVSAGGFSVSRATGRSFTSVAGNVYRGRYTVALSRALTGSESILIYALDGSFGASQTTLDATFGALASWTPLAGVVYTMVNSGTRSLTVQASTAITAPISVYITEVQYRDVTGQSNQNPSEYVSVGVLSSPFHGAFVDGVKYFDTLNGNTVASNVVLGGTGAAISTSTLLGYLAEGLKTQYFKVSAAPATQTSQSLGTGTYTLWMDGTGSIAVAGNTATITGAGTASAGTDVTFTVTVAGTVDLTVTGSPTRAQLENGPIRTSYIDAPSTSAVTRNIDRLAYARSGNVPDHNFTVSLEWTPIHHANASVGTMSLWESRTDASNYTAIQVTATQVIARKRIAGVNCDATIPLVHVRGTTYKIAARFSASTGIDVFLNGTKGTNHANTDTPVMGTNIDIGVDGAGSNPAFGNLRNLKHSRALSDAQVAAL